MAAGKKTDLFQLWELCSEVIYRLNADVQGWEMTLFYFSCVFCPPSRVKNEFSFGVD